MGSKSITIRLSGRFKKDLKRYKHDAVKVKALGEVIKHLKANGRVPLEYNPHKLHGFFEGCMECHIENDFLLIWIDEQTNVIKLLRFAQAQTDLRLGSHQAFRHINVRTETNNQTPQVKTFILACGVSFFLQYD